MKRTILISMLGALLAASLSSQQLSFFDLLPGSGPSGIAQGPDGALWITEQQANRITRLSVTGERTEFQIPTPNSRPSGITLGPDGNLWFIESGPGRIGRVTPSGQVTELLLPGGPAIIDGITSGPDGNVWITAIRAGPAGHAPHLAKISPSGTVTEYPLPRPNTAVGITAGPDGNIWYTRATQGESSIGRMTTVGQVTGEWFLNDGLPWDIHPGPDGNLWFTELTGNRIGRITPAGIITEFPIPTPNSDPRDLASGPDGHLYFTASNTNRVFRIALDGSITDNPLPGSDTRAIRITAGPGGMWFTVFPADRIGRLSADSCSDPLTLCLQNRFQVRLAWRRPGDPTFSMATPVPLTQDTGAFWFFSNANLELMVKVVDGRTVNGRFWVFFGSLTNVEFTLSVTDTVTGVTRTYQNQPGQLQSLADTAAF